MYDIKTINKTLKLLEQYDYKFIKVSRKLGIKVTTLRSKKKVNNKPLLNSTRNKASKWSDEYKKEILDYYFNHGENMMITYRKFGEPLYSTLKWWVHLDKRYKSKHIAHKKPVKYNDDIKKKILYYE